MQALGSSVTKGITIGTVCKTCDNSGAKIVKVVGVVGSKTTKRRLASAGVADLVVVAVKKGDERMKHKVAYGVVVRQKKEYKRADGLRVSFEDNSIALLKDDKRSPAGTFLKGPIAREIQKRWPALSKITGNLV